MSLFSGTFVWNGDDQNYSIHARLNSDVKHLICD